MHHILIQSGTVKVLYLVYYMAHGIFYEPVQIQGTEIIIITHIYFETIVL